ncbi:MAG: hypothetical protein C5B51_32400 [Terriglobia bacterium]|nr:MAG: hypothetical protein C5B51_32400 [Terriglobia bacterium]
MNTGTIRSGTLPDKIRSGPRLRIPWQQLRAALVRRIRYRITHGGLLFTFAIVLVGFGAVVSANNLLFLILATMLATLLISGMVSRLCLAGLELDFLVPEHVSARRTVPGRLFVRNQKWLLPSFSIRVEAIRDPASPSLKSGVYFPLITGRSAQETIVEVRFPKRGQYRQNSFAFSTSFPFGFLEKSARVTLRRETIVYPAIDPQPGFEDLLLGIAGEIETHYRGLGKDFYRIRPYEAFESARHVDWKATAHVGSLQIREFAREQEQTVEVFLDRDISPDLDPWFEHAVDCCAYLVWELSQRGTAIHFRSQGFDFRQPQDGDIYTILRFLALVYPQRGDAPEAPLEESSYRIVFTSVPARFREAGWAGSRMLGPETVRLNGDRE